MGGGGVIKVIELGLQRPKLDLAQDCFDYYNPTKYWNRDYVVKVVSLSKHKTSYYLPLFCFLSI